MADLCRHTSFLLMCVPTRYPLCPQKRPTMPAKETYYVSNRDRQKRYKCRSPPSQAIITLQKRPSASSKKTYVFGKRDVRVARSSSRLSPTTLAKETYHTRTRDLLHKQKRPISQANETYCTSKRDLGNATRPTTPGKATRLPRPCRGERDLLHKQKRPR